MLKAWEMDRDDPRAPTMMITVRLNVGGERDEMETWYGRQWRPTLIIFRPLSANSRIWNPAGMGILGSCWNLGSSVSKRAIGALGSP